MGKSTFFTGQPILTQLLHLIPVELVRSFPGASVVIVITRSLRGMIIWLACFSVVLTGVHR